MLGPMGGIQWNSRIFVAVQIIVQGREGDHCKHVFTDLVEKQEKPRLLKYN